MKNEEPYVYAINTQLKDLSVEELRYINHVIIDIKKNRNTCDECGGTIVHTNGCTQCIECGNSGCEL